MSEVKIQINLHECAGSSESSLGAHVQGYVFWRNDSIEFRENVLDKAFGISSNVFYL